MNTMQRTIVAAALACVPLLALAQGYKCRQADGSISYQDHACAAGTASSSTVPTDSGGGAAAPRGGVAPGGSSEASCEQSARHALSVCFAGTDVALKRCQATRMTAACRTQMSTPGVRPEPGLRQPGHDLPERVDATRPGLHGARTARSLQATDRRGQKESPALTTG